jgi:hypothetical protein
MKATTSSKNLLMFGLGAIALGLIVRAVYQAVDEGSLFRFELTTFISVVTALVFGRVWKSFDFAPLLGGLVGGAGQALIIVSVFVYLSINRPEAAHPTSRILSEGAIVIRQSAFLGASAGLLISAVLYALRRRAAAIPAKAPADD